MIATFVVTRTWAFLIAVAAILALVLLAHVILSTSNAPQPGSIVSARRRGIKALVIGADGRASTSKLQAILWFFAVFFAFTFLFVWGRSTDCGTKKKGVCAVSHTARGAFDKAVREPLQPEYFVLLGFPLTAALAAKALTTNKIVNGTKTDDTLDTRAAEELVAADDGEQGEAEAGDIPPPETPPTAGIARGLGEIISNNDGNADIMDFQYFAFNLLTLAYFYVQFLTHPVNGLPDLPPTLIALAGIAAATYTTKKALETDVQPFIRRVIPDPFTRSTTELEIIGQGFGSPPNGNPTAAQHVLLGGQALPVAASGWTDQRIVASLPAAVISSIGTATTVKVVVHTPSSQGSFRFRAVRNR